MWALDRIIFDTVCGFQDSIVLGNSDSQKMLWKVKVGVSESWTGETDSLLEEYRSSITWFLCDRQDMHK